MMPEVYQDMGERNCGMRVHMNICTVRVAIHVTSYQKAYVWEGKLKHVRQIQPDSFDGIQASLKLQ
jgi:hypothetical protein